MRHPPPNPSLHSMPARGPETRGFIRSMRSTQEAWSKRWRTVVKDVSINRVVAGNRLEIRSHPLACDADLVNVVQRNAVSVRVSRGSAIAKKRRSDQRDSRVANSDELIPDNFTVGDVV